MGDWDHGRWWYKIAHVCRRWRYLVLASASHLGLYLVCTYGTPVADMLAHSPPFPLIIDFGDEDHEVTDQDEDGILLAFRRRRRVRRIRLRMPASNLRRLVVAMDGEFPILEYLYIKPLANVDKDLGLPGTFKAQDLRHSSLGGLTTPPGVFHSPRRTPPVRYTEKISQVFICRDSQHWRYVPFRVYCLYNFRYDWPSPSPSRSQRSFLHILDDDSLLNIFNLCRPAILDEDEADDDRILQGGEWGRERWWHKLAHICRRWRYLLFASASYLGLSLVCTYGTPLAAILTHSPPIPLIIDCIDRADGITAEDQDRIILALQHRDRVRRIRLKMPLQNLYSIRSAFDQEFPILDYLYIEATTEGYPAVTLPITFQALHLRHLILIHIGVSIRSPLLVDSVDGVTGLVTLSLLNIRSDVFFHSGDLLQRLSFMPLLETLGITFHSGTKRMQPNMSIATSVTLPNLRWFAFGGASAYLEALLPQMTIPHLEKLQLRFFDQQMFSVPCLVKFMETFDNVEFGSAKLRFYKDEVDVEVYPYHGATMYTFSLCIDCGLLNQQVASTARIFHALRTVFSTVDHLTLEFLRYPILNAAANTINRVQWRELLRSFGSVKTLYVDDDFLGQISDSLCVRSGESPMDPLPQLKELEYYPGGAKKKDFKSFINARKDINDPISVVCRRSSPIRGQLVSRGT